MKSKNLSEHRKLSPLKDNFQRLMSLFEKDRDKIVRYVLGMYSRKFHRKSNINMFKEDISEKEVYGLMDFLFFHVSFAPSYRNLQLLIIIITKIDEDIDGEIVNKCLQSIVTKYSFIFNNANVNDIQNLLLVITNKGIQLPVDVERDLWEKVKDSKNPITIATFLEFSRYNLNFFNEIKLHVNKSICNDLGKITKYRDLFLYEEIWWVFMFIDCPYIAQDTKDAIQCIIAEMPTNDSSPKGLTRNLIYEYLSDNSITNKFIRWNHVEVDIAKEITYKTLKKTIFTDGEEFYSLWEY